MSEQEFSVDKDRKRNVLTLSEKVAAIRRFELYPEYRSVGRYFKCSSYQIKGIIENKCKILEEWNKQRHEPVAPKSHADRSVKEALLGKAVYEWIRRTMYFTDFNLTDSLVQTVAIEFKREINLHNFFPGKDWIAKFRQTYDLKDVNTKTLNIGYGESHSAQPRDIVQHLRLSTFCDAVPETKQTENDLGNEEYLEIDPDEPILEPELFCDPPGSIDSPPLEQHPLPKIIKPENFSGEEKYAEIDPAEPMLEPELFCDPPGSSDSPPLEQQPQPKLIKLENFLGGEKYSEIDPDEPTPEPELFCDPPGSCNSPPLEQQPQPKLIKPKKFPGEEKYAEIDPDEPMLDPTNLYSPSCSSNSSPLKEKPLEIKIELRPSAVPAVLHVKDERVGEKAIEVGQPPKKVINTAEEAFSCIKVLEDFALLKENYRLIGLIERLEEVLKAEI